MSQQAIGLLETRGLVALVEGTDAMLKAANVTLAGPMKQVGSALVTSIVTGDVAAVKAAAEAGAQAVKSIDGTLVIDSTPRNSHSLKMAEKQNPISNRDTSVPLLVFWV